MASLKLHQLLAIASGVTAETKKELGVLGQAIGNDDLYNGEDKTYKPRAEAQPGEEPTAATTPLPAQHRKVRVTAREVLSQLRRVTSRRWDVQRAVDAASAGARADVVLRDGSVLLAGVPVRHLMYLEAELTELHARLEQLPVLNPAREWPAQAGADGIRHAEPVTATREDTVVFNHVLYPATKEHPANVQLMKRQEAVGTWTTVFASGAVSADEKFGMLTRLTEVREAVKIAREQANTADAPDIAEGADVFAYVLGGYAS